MPVPEVKITRSENEVEELSRQGFVLRSVVADKGPYLRYVLEKAAMGPVPEIRIIKREEVVRGVESDGMLNKLSLEGWELRQVVHSQSPGASFYIMEKQHSPPEPEV